MTLQSDRDFRTNMDHRRVAEEHLDGRRTFTNIWTQTKILSLKHGGGSMMLEAALRT